MTAKCVCGRTLCDLCEKERAIYVMGNKINGNKLNVCKTCYRLTWGKEGGDKP